MSRESMPIATRVSRVYGTYPETRSTCLSPRISHRIASKLTQSPLEPSAVSQHRNFAANAITGLYSSIAAISHASEIGKNAPQKFLGNFLGEDSGLVATDRFSTEGHGG